MDQFSFAELGAVVRVHNDIQKTVVYVGFETAAGFLPVGTGFVLVAGQDNEMFQYVLTARHIIALVPDGLPVQIRLNTHEGKARVLPTDKASWLLDEEADLAVCPMTVDPAIYDVLHLSFTNALTDAAIKQWDIGIGDDVILCGMFLSHPGNAKNLPIVRGGIISAMPSEKIRTVYGYHHAYLIEARSTYGISGSPVFAHMAPFRYVQDRQIRSSQGSFSEYFMGMVLGFNKVAYPPELLKFVPDSGMSEEDQREDERERSIPLNSGIAIVLPQYYIARALNDPRLVEMRARAIETLRKNKGYVPTASIMRKEEQPSAPSDSNPEHREAFNSLLGAAAKTKRQDG